MLTSRDYKSRGQMVGGAFTVKMFKRFACFAAVIAVVVASLFAYAGRATATPNVTITTTATNGLVIGTAPPGTVLDWQATMSGSNCSTHTVTTDANGQWVFQMVGICSFWVNVQEGYSITVSVAPTGTTNWTSKTLTVDRTLDNFVVTPPSGTYTSTTVPIPINVTFTGYVVVKYIVPPDSDTVYYSPHIPVTSTGPQTLQWNPGTPLGASKTYQITKISMYDGVDIEQDWDNIYNNTVTQQLIMSVTAPSGTITTEDVPFSINATAAGYAVLTYEVLKPGSPATSLGDTYTSQHIPVNGTGTQALNWRPGTPPGASVIYHVKSVTAYDSTDSIVGSDSTGFTFTHQPVADYTLSFSGPGILAGGVIINDMSSHTVTVTLKHGSTPVPGVAILRDGNLFGTTNASGQVTGPVTATLSPKTTHFTATASGKPVSAYLAFPILGQYVLDLTVVDTDGTAMPGTVTAYSSSGSSSGLVGPNTAPVILSADQTELYFQGTGKKHLFLMRNDVTSSITNGSRLAVTLYASDPNLGRVTVTSPLPTNRYAIAQTFDGPTNNWKLGKHVFQTGTMGNLDMFVPWGTWDVVDTGLDSSGNDYVLYKQVGSNPGSPGSVDLSDTLTTLATVHASAPDLPGYQTTATLQIGYSLSGAVSSVPLTATPKDIKVATVDPNNWGLGIPVFKVVLDDLDTFSYVHGYAEFVPGSVVANGMAYLQPGQTYNVDASGTGTLEVEDWGHGRTNGQPNLTSGTGDTFRGRLRFHNANGDFYTWDGTASYSYTVTGPTSVQVSQFGDWFMFDTPVPGSYNISATYNVGPFFRFSPGGTTATAKVTTSEQAAYVDGAFDGRGLRDGFMITGNVAHDVASRTVTFTVGQTSNGCSGAVWVDAYGRFTISCSLPNRTDGQWIPVTVQVPGDSRPGVSFTAIMGSYATDLLTTAQSPSTPQTMLTLWSHVAAMRPFDLKGIHLEYTAETGSPDATTNWTVGQVTNQVVPNGQAMWGGEIRSNEEVTAGWVVPQNGPGLYQVRYAAEDWAGILGPWHYLTVSVAPVSVMLSAGDGGNPVHVGQLQYVTVNVQVNNTNQPHYWVYADGKSYQTDGSGNVVIPVFSADSEVIPVEVYKAPASAGVFNPNDLVASTAIFVLDPATESGLVISAKDSNGPLHDLDIAYTDATGAQKGRQLVQDKLYAIVPTGTYRTTVTAPAFNRDQLWFINDNTYDVYSTSVTSQARYVLFQEDVLSPGQVKHVDIDATNTTIFATETWTVFDGSDPATRLSNLVLKAHPNETKTFEDAEISFNDYGQVVVLYKADATDTLLTTYYGQDDSGNPTAIRSHLSGYNADSYTYFVIPSQWYSFSSLLKITNGATDQAGNPNLFDMDLTLTDSQGPLQLHIPAGGYAYVPAPSSPNPYPYDYVLSHVTSGNQAGDYTRESYYFHGSTPLSGSQGTTVALNGGGPLTLSFNVSPNPAAAGDAVAVDLGAQNAASEQLTKYVKDDYVSYYHTHASSTVTHIDVQAPSTPIGSPMPLGSNQALGLPAWMGPGSYGLTATFNLGAYGSGLTATQTLAVNSGAGFAVTPILAPLDQTATGSLKPGGALQIGLTYTPKQAQGALTTTISGSVFIDPTMFTVVHAPVTSLPNTTVTFNAATHMVTITTSAPVNLYANASLMSLVATPAAGATLPLSFTLGPTDLSFTASVGNQNFTVPYSVPTPAPTLMPLQTLVSGDVVLSGQPTMEISGVVFGPGAAQGTVVQSTSLNGSIYELENGKAGSADLVAARAGYLGSTTSVTVPTGQELANQSLSVQYGDLNADGQITTTDLDILAQNLHQTDQVLPVDANGDHSTDLHDLVTAARNYGNAESTASLAANYGALTVSVSYAGALTDSPLNPVAALYVRDQTTQNPGLRVPVVVIPAMASIGTTYTFSFSHVPAGQYEVEFATPGYDPGRQTVTVTAGGSASANLTTKVAMTARVIGAANQGQDGVIVAGGVLPTQVISYPLYDQGTQYSDVGSLTSGSHVEYTWDGADTETFLASQLTPNATYYIGVQDQSGGHVQNGVVIEVAVGRNVHQITVSGVSANTAHADEWLGFIVTVDGNGAATITVEGLPVQFSLLPPIS